MTDLFIQTRHDPEQCTAKTVIGTKETEDSLGAIEFACQRERHARGRHRWENPETGHSLEWPDAPRKA